MSESLASNGRLLFRFTSFISGLGMLVFSLLTVEHFFAANYPASIFEGSFCDINAFFNCDSSAFSSISQVWGVPLGYFGMIVGALVVLGSLFPSPGFERTNKSISLANATGVVVLFLFSVFYLGSLCLLCSGFYFFSLVSFLLFWRYGIRDESGGMTSGFLRPSLKHVAVFAVITLAGAYGFSLFHTAKKEAQSGGVAARIVKQYFELPKVELPSTISPFYTTRATERFEDAPIRIVEYADFLCSDCRYLNEQLVQLKEEFAGKMNIAFQFFPLDAQCNQVVDKNSHPGACELSYLSAYDPSKFGPIHDEVFANIKAARDPEWRLELAKRHGVGAALQDQGVKDLVHSIIATGAEYEKTSDKFAHGIRSTPTMIVNNRMIIGTLPYVQLRAIFQALVDEAGNRDSRFLENWVQP